MFAGWGGVAEELAELGRGDEAVTDFVEADVDEFAAADFEAPDLLGEREEKIFGHAPVKEGADSGGGDDSEKGELAGHDEGLFGGGDQAVLGVEGEEDFELFVEGEVRWDVAVGKKDVAERTAVEEDAGVVFSDGAEGVLAADNWCGHPGAYGKTSAESKTRRIEPRPTRPTSVIDNPGCSCFHCGSNHESFHRFIHRVPLCGHVIIRPGGRGRPELAYVS